MLFLISAAQAGEPVRTEDLVKRCSGPEISSNLAFEIPGIDRAVVEKQFIGSNPLLVAGAVSAKARKGYWVAFEVYRKDLPDQRYAIVGVVQPTGPKKARKLKVLKSTELIDLGFRHHLLGFYPELKTGGDVLIPLRVCRAWLGDPEHFYREFLRLLVPQGNQKLAVGLRSLMTESEKFGESTDSVTLREATLFATRPGAKGLTKKLSGSRLEVRYHWKNGHYEFEGTNSKDPLSPTPTDGP